MWLARIAYFRSTIRLDIKRRHLKFAALLILMSMLAYLHMYGKTAANFKSSSSRSTKTILLWNAPQRIETLIFGSGSDVFSAHGCQVSDCEIFNSRFQYPHRTLDSYDAIIFNFNDEYVLDQWPKFVRQPHQRFILLTQEAPPSLRYYNFESFRNYFNWTMTYRMDSDIPMPYGRILPKSKDSEVSERFRRIPREGKSRRLVAAMISHCETHSRREDYVKQLKQYIPVTVYGECMDFDAKHLRACRRDEVVSSTPDCYKVLETKYKFYLSFENAICPDYVTEKFFNILLRDMVPVVYGGANYSSFAPPHSYIDASQFSPKELAKYLLKLDQNDDLYQEYFSWKDHYTVEAGVRLMAQSGFCELCRKLHQDAEPKTYSDVSTLWHPKRCHRPKKSKPLKA